MKFKKFLKYLLLLSLILFLGVFSYFFVGRASQSKEIIWGINFSQKHTQNLGLDWKTTYSALLDDLGIKNIKIAVHWDLIGSKENDYNFSDLDWQIQKAEEKEAKVILVIGMKTSRWPECHIPQWAGNIGKSPQQEKILEMIKEIVLRYKNRNNIRAWQVENEPFFPFGECPWTDENFLKKEVALVKSLDFQGKPVIISDSGEFSLWLKPAKIGDIVGTTIYKKAWFKKFNTYISYCFPPVFYQRKAQIIKKIFKKEVICVELQAEPWGPQLLYSSSLPEQEKTMNLEQFRKNINFARKTGLKEFYLWGAEWWYWMKEKQNQPEIWEEAKNLFK